MANTYWQITFIAVLAVQGRQAIIREEKRKGRHDATKSISRVK